MQATIHVDAAVFSDLEISPEQFREAAAYALSKLTHPETGETLYFNGVGVTIATNEAE